MSSSSARRSYDTDSIVFRRMYAYDLANNPFSTGYILTSLQKGVVTFCNINTSLSSIGVPNLPVQLSTLTGILLSSIDAFAPSLLSSPDTFLPSTVAGLGTAGYVSSPSLQSSLIGLGTLGYISTSQLVSTTAGIFNQQTVQPNDLASTVQGLATSGYISSSQLFSTIDSLSFYGYISSSGLQSTVEGLGSAGYISTSQLISTVDGLGSINYISSSQMTSTSEGLGTLGYISAASFFSSFASQGILRSSYANRLIGNFSNFGFLYSNIPAGSNWRSLEFTFGSTFVQKITTTSKLDIELQTNMQFAYYDPTSRNYSFSTFLVAGGDSNLQFQRILASTSMTYYIENARPINLPFFFKNNFRFLLNNDNAFSTIRAYGAFSTFTLWHGLGNPAPTTNQFYSSPDVPTCVNVVLDNTQSP